MFRPVKYLNNPERVKSLNLNIRAVCILREIFLAISDKAGRISDLLAEWEII